jgi:hypothetical protein
MYTRRFRVIRSSSGEVVAELYAPNAAAAVAEHLYENGRPAPERRYYEAVEVTFEPPAPLGFPIKGGAA